MQPEFKNVAVLDLLLNRDNPRHVGKQNQQEVIEYLLKDEEVYNLARHMSKNGINPLEVVAVFPDAENNIIIAEGNRRICAAQLLTDPEKAPEKERKKYKALAKKSVDVSTVAVALFDDYKTAQPWLQVLHDGEQDGVGRRRWKPEQKARATTNKSTDALAVALLGYAEDKGIISAQTRAEILVSTATRYLANPAVRNAMGVASTATTEDFEIDVDVETFEKILADFFDKILSKELHSRSKTEEWLKYADDVNMKFRSTPIAQRAYNSQTADPEPPSASAQTDQQSRASLKAPEQHPIAAQSLQQASPRKSQRPTRAKIVTPETKFISRSRDLIDALNKLGSFKLSSIYNSITLLQLNEHPALLTTGSWVFIENLTAIHGRPSTTEFVAYFGNLMTAWGMSKDEKKDCRLSLEYISQNGNAQKHSAKYTVIDARNLCNHFHVLESLLVRTARECVSAAQNNP